METAVIDDISVLIEQARGGDAAAFGQVVRRYQSLVSGVVFSVVGDFHKSEDLAQETFLTAWSKLADLKNTDDPAPWLCTIARNLANRSFRKKQEKPTEIVDDQAASPQSDPARELLRKEQSELVWSAIGEIPEQYRETLVLYYRSEKSVREIAAATNSSIDAVNQRLVRARQSLKSKLETMIGDILSDSAPGEVFTLGVLTTLSSSFLLSCSSNAVAATVGTTTTVGTAGKAVGGFSLIGTIIPTLWNLMVPWIVGNFLWTRICNAPTLRSRGYLVMTILRTYQFFWGFILALMISAGLNDTIFGFRDRALITVASLFLGCSICGFSCFWFWLRWRQTTILVKEDLGIPTGKPRNSFTYEKLEKSFFRTLFFQVLFVETLLGLAGILSLRDGSIQGRGVLIAAGLVFGFSIYQYFFYRVGRLFLGICRDAAGYFSAPPLHDDILERTVLKKEWIFDPERANDFLYGKSRVLRKTCSVAVWLMLLYSVSQFSWRENPISLAVIFALLILVNFVFNRLNKNYAFINGGRNRWCYLHLSISFLINSLISFALIQVEFRDISTGIFQYLGMALAGEVVLTQGQILACSLVLGFASGFTVSLFFLLFKPVKAITHGSDETENEEVLKKIAAFRAVFHKPEGDSPKLSALEIGPFPKNWTKTCFVYGGALLTVFVLYFFVQYKVVVAQHYARQEDYDTAILWNPNNPVLYYERARGSRAERKAIADCDTAIRFDPEYAEAYVLRGRRYAVLGKQEAALSDYDIAIEILRKQKSLYSSYRLARTLFDRGDFFLNEGNEEAAIADYREAVRLDPGGYNYLKLAEFYVKIEDYGAALESCNEGIRVQKRFRADSYYMKKLVELQKSLLEDR